MSTSSQTIEARNKKVLQDMEPSARLGQNWTVELNQGHARRLVARLDHGGLADHGQSSPGNLPQLGPLSAFS
jgi:hypothetical protein